jgi:ADP-heptose:LPS heptosyltransferase
VKRHVLVARLDNDGDVLLAGPAIRAIAHAAGPVTLLCGPRGRAAAELLPGVSRVVVFRAPWIDPEPDPVDPELVAGLVAELRALAPDEAVVLTSFHQSPLPLALLLRLAGVPRIAAMSVDYPGSLLDVRHGVEGDVHEVERSLSLVARLGYRLPRDDDGSLAVERVEPSPVDPPYVVVHPGASVSARAWEPQRNAELVAALAAEGRRVVVTGGPGERELTALVAGGGGNAVIDLGGRTTFAGLAGVLASAGCVVAGNTGPAHLAAAVGTPVVSLFAPTVPVSSWRPWGVPHVLLGAHDISCAGCRSRVCPIHGHPCLGVIGVDDVLEAVESFAPSVAQPPGTAPLQLEVVR